MTARLESIGRISEKGLEKVREILLNEDEEQTILNVKISVSSYFDIAVATRGDKGVVLQPKFLNDSSCQVMNFSASAEINSLYGDITASAILPGISILSYIVSISLHPYL